MCAFQVFLNFRIIGAFFLFYFKDDAVPFLPTADTTNVKILLGIHTLHWEIDIFSISYEWT